MLTFKRKRNTAPDHTDEPLDAHGDSIDKTGVDSATVDIPIPHSGSVKYAFPAPGDSVAEAPKLSIHELLDMIDQIPSLGSNLDDLAGGLNCSVADAKTLMMGVVAVCEVSQLARAISGVPEGKLGGLAVADAFLMGVMIGRKVGDVGAA